MKTTSLVLASIFLSVAAYAAGPRHSQVSDHQANPSVQSRPAPAAPAPARSCSRGQGGRSHASVGTRVVGSVPCGGVQDYASYAPIPMGGVVDERAPGANPVPCGGDQTSLGWVNGGPPGSVSAVVSGFGIVGQPTCYGTSVATRGAVWVRLLGGVTVSVPVPGIGMRVGEHAWFSRRGGRDSIYRR